MVFEFTTYFKRHFINIRSKFIFSKQKVLSYSSINFIAVECLNRLNYVYFIDLWKFYLKLNNNIYTNINFFWLILYTYSCKFYLNFSRIHKPNSLFLKKNLFLRFLLYKQSRNTWSLYKKKPYKITFLNLIRYFLLKII